MNIIKLIFNIIKYTLYVIVLLVLLVAGFYIAAEGLNFLFGIPMIKTIIVMAAGIIGMIIYLIYSGSEKGARKLEEREARYAALEKQQLEAKLRRQGKNYEADLADELKSKSRKIKEFSDTLRKQLHPIHNILLPVGNGATTEIDLAMVFPSGVYLIECKSHKTKSMDPDTIRGDITGESWAWSAENTIHNPLLQNEGHVAAFKATFGENIPVYNVVFVQGNYELHHWGETFKSEMIKGEPYNPWVKLDVPSLRSAVFTYAGYEPYKDTLKLFINAVSVMPSVFTDEEVVAINNAISHYVGSAEALAAHTEKVKALHS